MYKLASILFILLFSISSLKAQKKYEPDWLFIYYMPYDNNLSQYGDTIKNMLSKGLINEKVMVTIQADYADSLGMKRFVLSNDTTIESTVSTENSASSKTLGDYLSWVKDHFDSKKYCLVFLDHGGGLDELCLDENPGPNYLKIDSTSQAILKFDKEIAGKIELLFFQVCAKGSIEPIYEVKECSNYTMFSQVALGSPNYYYEKMLKYVARNPNLNGKDVAEQIALNDRYNMYSSYVCIENNKLDSLKIYFNDFIASIGPTDSIELNDSKLTKFYYGWDCYWDMRSFLNSLTLDEDSGKIKDTLLNYITHKLIVLNKANPKIPDMNRFCGLSLYAFSNKNYSSYTYLQFYKDFMFRELKRKIHLNNK